jgi:hypothetical protein
VARPLGHGFLNERHSNQAVLETAAIGCARPCKAPATRFKTRFQLALRIQCCHSTERLPVTPVCPVAPLAHGSFASARSADSSAVPFRAKCKDRKAKRFK